MSCGPPGSSAFSGPRPTQGKFSQDAEFNASGPGTVTVGPSRVAEVQNAQGSVQEFLAIAGDGDEAMYLSGCRVYFAGFEPAELRRLVNLVLGGGGTRHMQFSERITHIIFGKPAKSELMDIRKYALWGAVHIVLPAWLEECSQQRREVAVSAQFVVTQTLLSQDFHSKPGRNPAKQVREKKPTGKGARGTVMKRPLIFLSKAQADATVSQDNDLPRRPLSMLASNSATYPSQGAAPDPKKHVSPALLSPVAQCFFEEQPHARSHSMLSKDNDAQQARVPDIPYETRPVSSQDLKKQIPHPEEAGHLTQETIKKPVTGSAGSQQMSYAANTATSSAQWSFEAEKRVFERCVFEFAPSFETHIRAEVISQVLIGGGRMLGDVNNSELQELKFVIYPPGPIKDPGTQFSITSVTKQWIDCCLQDRTLLDINSHITFQPLRCEVPFPGFESFSFAVSQYEDRERMLLHELCRVLGARNQKTKMTRRATHLLCKVGDGDKYQAASKWGVEIVTADWVYACVAQNMIVPTEPYRPKRLTAADKEARLATPTQYPAHSTPCDTGVPSTERCSRQDDAELPVLTQVTHFGRVETKGKTASIKRKSNLRGRSHSAAMQVQALHCQRELTNFALSSQIPGGHLDPWDEVTASWTSQDEIGQPPLTSQPEPVDSVSGLYTVPSEIQGELSDDLKQSTQNPEGCQATESCRQVLVSEEEGISVDHASFENEEGGSGRDVASAIEEFLAQTSKVQTEDASRSPDVGRDLWSCEPIQLNRRNSEDLQNLASFKRPKLHLNRSIDSAAEQLVQCATPAGNRLERFEESELDCQVVSYNEDNSEQQRLKERVRTRSMSTANKSGSAVNVHHRKKVSWKGTELDRLLKAADANK